MLINGTLGIEKILKLYGPFLWMGLNCLKATEPLQGDSLLFTDRFPGVVYSFDWLLKDEKAESTLDPASNLKFDILFPAIKLRTN